MKTEALHDKLAETLTEIKVDTLVTLLSEIRLSPPQRLPLRIPQKKTIIEKNRKAREGRWEERNGGSLCHIMFPRWRLISEEDWI